VSDLDSISQAILDYVKASYGYIAISGMIDQIARVTGVRHANEWYFRRLVALALEGHIEAKVSRACNQLFIKFRRLQEGENK